MVLVLCALSHNYAISFKLLISKSFKFLCTLVEIKHSWKRFFLKMHQQVVSLRKNILDYNSMGSVNFSKVKKEKNNKYKFDFNSDKLTMYELLSMKIVPFIKWSRMIFIFNFILKVLLFSLQLEDLLVQSFCNFLFWTCFEGSVSLSKILWGVKLDIALKYRMLIIASSFTKESLMCITKTETDKP